MTEIDLRKMNRYQLLEMLIVQTEREEKLKAHYEVIKKQLYDKEIKTSSLGSIAEASLQLKGVFDAAQNAADMYIEAAKKRAEEIEADAKKNAEEIITRAKEEARRIKDEADI